MAIIKMGIQDDAHEIKYQNTESGLSATNVKTAIDELQTIKSDTTHNHSFVNLTNKPEPFLSNNYSFPSNDGALVTLPTDIPQILQTNGSGSVTWQNKYDSGWKDINAEMMMRPNTTNPILTVMSGVFYAYVFALNKEVWCTFHINHDYKPGGEILLHVHWTTNGTQTRSVKWQIDYTIAKGYNQSSGGNFFNQTYQVFVEEVPPAVAWRHMTTEISSTVNLTNVEPDSLILAHFKRVANGATDNSNTVFGLSFDAHYETNRLATINRRPNFYS